MKFEVKPRLFYKVGCWCFGIGAVANTVTFGIIFRTLMFTQIVSQIASLVFNYFIFGFFLYLYRQVPPEIKNPVTDKEIEEMLEVGKK